MISGYRRGDRRECFITFPLIFKSILQNFDLNELIFVFLPYDGPGDGQARIPSGAPVLAGLVLGPEHLVIYRVVPLNKLADPALCFW